MAFCILNTKTGLVLDIETTNAAVGKVILFRSHGGTNQQWTYNDDQIFSQHSGKVLQVNEQTKKIEVCSRTGKPNQRWTFDNDGYVKNNGTGLYLDIQGDKKAAGAEVIAQPQHCCKNQKFRRIDLAIKLN